MPSERLTTRKIMIFVVIVAVALGLVWPLVDTLHHQNWHLHTYVLKTPGGLYMPIPQQTREPILSQYYRRLTGRDPREKRHCGATWSIDEEVCSLEHPEIIIGGRRSGDFRPLPRQTEFADRMNAETRRKLDTEESAKSNR